MARFRDRARRIGRGLLRAVTGIAIGVAAIATVVVLVKTAPLLLALAAVPFSYSLFAVGVGEFAEGIHDIELGIRGISDEEQRAHNPIRDGWFDGCHQTRDRFVLYNLTTSIVLANILPVAVYGASALKAKMEAKLNQLRGNAPLRPTGQPPPPVQPPRPRVFTSDDPQVGETATAIDARFPGRVTDVNRIIFRPDGSRLTDFDIEMDTVVIQVKTRTAKRLLAQLRETATGTDRIVVGFAPDRHDNSAVVRGARAAGFHVFTTLEDLLDFLARH